MNSNEKGSLSERLKKAVTSIHVDVFGHEKQVQQNIRSYFKELSKKIEIPVDRIVVRIFKDQGHVRSCIYQKGRCVYEISLKELILLFTGTHPTTLENKVSQTIKLILNDFAVRHHVDDTMLQLCILVKNDTPYIKGVCKTKVIGGLKIKTLIPYFIG